MGADNVGVYPMPSPDRRCRPARRAPGVAARRRRRLRRQQGLAEHRPRCRAAKILASPEVLSYLRQRLRCRPGEHRGRHRPASTAPASSRSWAGWRPGRCRRPTPTPRPPSSTNGTARASCCSMATPPSTRPLRRWTRFRRKLSRRSRRPTGGALRRSPSHARLPMTANAWRPDRTSCPDPLRPEPTPPRARRASRLLFVLPAIMLVLVFRIIPLFWGFGLSLTSATSTDPGEFIGAGNYLRALDDPNFRASHRQCRGGAAFGPHLCDRSDAPGDPDRPGRAWTRLLPLRLFLSRCPFERHHRLDLQRCARLQRQPQRVAQGARPSRRSTGWVARRPRCP